MQNIRHHWLKSPASPSLNSWNDPLAGYINLFVMFSWQDIEAKKEAQKEKEIDEQEANASTMHRCRTMLDKDLINTGIYESAGKQSLPLVQLVQQLLRYLPFAQIMLHLCN